MKLLLTVCSLLFFADAWSQKKVVFYDQRSHFELRENMFFVDVFGEDIDDLVFSTDNGEISDTLNLVTYRPYRAGKSTIMVFKKKNNKNFFLDSVVFHVSELIYAQARVGTQTKGTITKDQLLAFGSLRAMVLIRAWHTDPVQIASFTVVITKENGENVCINNEGSKFNDPLRDAIQKTNKGDRITFTNIRAHPFAERDIPVSPIEFTIQ